ATFFLLTFHSVSAYFSALFLSCFFSDTATSDIYTLSLHDALPISHSGLLEVGTEGPLDEPDGGEVLHPGEACALDVVEEGAHDADGIGAVDTGQHRRVLDHRKHLVRHLHHDGVRVAVGHQAGQRSAAGHPVPPGVVDD